jgi:predicted phosphoribosyltransferase
VVTSVLTNNDEGRSPENTVPQYHQEVAMSPRWAATDQVAPARPFHDRFEAGRVLASLLSAYANRPGAVVLGLPRGGVAVAYEVARALHLPLDVFIVRKLGVPGQEELAMGAIASGGVRVLNHAVINALGLGQADIDQVVRREEQELHRRERLFRGERPPPDLKGKIVIVVDDGLATGATMWAAIAAIRQQAPARIVMAVPVAAPTECDAFRQIAEEVVCAVTAEPLHAVGLWYQDFPQMTDEEVRALLTSPSPDPRTSPSPLAGEDRGKSPSPGPRKSPSPSGGG